MVIPRAVFAHYMVGLTYMQSAEQWGYDIGNASAAAIDGFALNIGPSDSYTLDSLRHAYDAAAKFDNFTLFLSFDFQATGGSWSPKAIADLTNTFKDEPAQFKVDGKPLVSTFEGVAFADQWSQARSQVDGDIFLVPDWSSLGADGLYPHLNEIDGAFSFDAWPTAGQTNKTTDSDVLYNKVLKQTSQANKFNVKTYNGKAYMMGVSPYFYTKLSQLGKNWYSSSDSLWYDRWQQVLDVMPDLVEIVSWNDFGESHHIGNNVEAQIMPSAKPYVDGLSHAGFRAILPYFIAAYKAGTKNITLPESMGDGAVSAWYRTTPIELPNCSDGGTKWGQSGSDSAKDGVRDVINIVAVSARDTSLTVSLGEASYTVQVASGAPQFFQVSFAELNNQRGTVSISMGNQTATGAAITDECPESGVVSDSVLVMLLTIVHAC
ncbi:glycoside hydrolase [Cercophora scortea]|uniref:Glycoside hydrolase n=1 Tax=Cercophora scortea TaxID=314031 RepID=A0AAE0I6Y3_9PEZI|nr:glycoside hydrolase [Cercophora scortea]